MYKAEVVIYFKALCYCKFKEFMGYVSWTQPDILPVLLYLKEAMINQSNEHKIVPLPLFEISAYGIQVSNTTIMHLVCSIQQIWVEIYLAVHTYVNSTISENVV